MTVWLALSHPLGKRIVVTEVDPLSSDWHSGNFMRTGIAFLKVSSWVSTVCAPSLFSRLTIALE